MSLQDLAIVTDTSSAISGLITALTLQHKLTGLDCTLSVFTEQISEQKDRNAVYLVEQDLIQILKALGLSEKDLIKACDGNIHLGEMHKTFQNDTTKIKQRFNSRGPLGVSISGVAFHHLLVQCKKTHQDIDESLVSYSLLGQLYAQNRFMPPSQDKRSIASSIEYGILVNAAKFQDQLAYLCEKLHISCYESTTVNLIKQTEVTPTYNELALGKVKLIALGNDEHIEQFPVDFIFDTRHRSPDSEQLPLHQYTWAGELNEKVEDEYQHNIIKLSDGLAQVILSNNRLAVELTLSNAEQDSKEACFAEITTYLSDNYLLGSESIKWHSTSKALQDPQEHIWRINIVNLASVESTFACMPMRRTPLCDIIDLWLQFYPAKFEQASETYQVLSNTFNQLSLKYQQNVHDFERLMLLPLSANKSNDEIKGAPSYSESLRSRINLFENTGTDYLTEQDCIAPHAWRNLALALSYWPKHYDPVADSIPNASSIVSNMAQQIEAASKQAPSLGQFLTGVVKAS